jgi:type II secretory pathway pseudopilin PulG
MRRSRSNRDGLTLIEAVAAITLLAVLAAMVLSSLSGMIKAQTRQMQRLGAGEIANRLMLQYLDDPQTMPGEGLPVAYDGARYRWQLAKSAARLTPAVAGDNSRGGLSLDRLGTVTVRVWLSEESGGAATFGQAGVPNYTLTRVVDPTYVFRNPDSLDNMIKNPQRMREFQEMFTGVEQGGFINRRDGGSSGTPSRGSTGKPAEGTPSRGEPTKPTREPSRSTPTRPAGNGRGGGKDGDGIRRDEGPQPGRKAPQ